MHSEYLNFKTHTLRNKISLYFIGILTFYSVLYVRLYLSQSLFIKSELTDRSGSSVEPPIPNILVPGIQA